MQSQFLFSFCNLTTNYQLKTLHSNFFAVQRVLMRLVFFTY